MQSQLFGDAPSKIERVKKPKFKHSYISDCTFLGTYKGHDLYHSILSNGTPMLLERYSSDTFKFNGEEAKKIKEMGKGSYLFEAYERARKSGLIL